jgi:hypothetical protein
MMVNINLLLLGIVVISGFVMLNYLRDKGSEKSRIFTFNPMFVFEYIRITKQEFGHIGIWFWILLVSFLSLIILGIIELSK